MRQPLATRRKAEKPYKTLIQVGAITNFVMPLQILISIYDGVEAAIAEMQKYKLAADLRRLQEEIKDQDNSDLHIITLPDRRNQEVTE